MADDKVEVFYSPADLKQITRAFKAMSDEAVDQSKKMGFELASYAVGQIQNRAKTIQEKRIAATGRAKKSSKIGEFSFGYQRKDFSGGANTSRNIERSAPYGNGILAGIEFGSYRLKNFRARTPRMPSGGNQGYFINPTLREIQPEIVKKWEYSFNEILEKG